MVETFLDALHADPWTAAPLDLPELNQAASSLIEARIAAIRDVAGAKPGQLRSESLVLLGPPGTGKTHLFSRLRARLGPRAVFVHIRPLLHAGLTPSYVLSQAVQQLAQPSYKRDDPQADMLVGSLIGYLGGQSTEFPQANVIAFRELPEAERVGRLDRLTDELFDVFPDLDDAFVGRLLALAFSAPRDRRALLAWLSGQDCDPSQLARIGATASMDPSNAVRALRTLTSVAAVGAPLVIVFDQLENLVQHDATEERITQYGNLVAELVDATRGLLVVQMALDSEWEQAIAPRLNLSQRSRVVMAKAALSLPTSKQSHSLLELWCGELEEPGRSFPWPLNAEQLERLCSLPGVTPRMLLSALREAREGREPSILELPSDMGSDVAAGDARDEGSELRLLLAAEWAQQVASAHEQLDRAEQRGGSVDVGRLRDGVQLASAFCSDGSLKGASDQYVQLESKAKDGRWVCLLHQSHYRSVQAALDRVLAKAASSKGLVVREQWRAFPPTWKTVADRQAQVLANAHLVWHELGREEAAHLLALEAFMQLARSRDICDSRGIPVTEAQVLEHVRNAVRPESWPVFVKLTSDASSSFDETGALETHAEDKAPHENNAPEPNVLRPHVDKHGGSNSGTISDELSAGVVDAAKARVLAVLRRLYVASVDRTIREVHRLEPGLGRAAVMSGLQALGDRVMWFGRSIVALHEDAATTAQRGAGNGEDAAAAPSEVGQ